jgi:hypothetical protein
MGIFKFLANLSPGSPKATAIKCLERYDYFHPYSEDRTDTYKAIFGERLFTHAKNGTISLGVLEKIDVDNIMEFCEDDFPTFVFCLMALESNSFRNGCKTNDLTFDTAIESIFDAVRDKNLSLITKKYSQYRIDCLKICQ